MDIAMRRICLIRLLPDANEKFLKPSDIGGCDRSYHSNDLIAMCKLGLVEKRRFFVGSNSKGHWRYRLTVKGMEIRKKIDKEIDIIPYRKYFLLRKNGLTAKLLNISI